MSPGAWGRFKGLPVLAEGVKWLQGMGTSLFRMGGSFCSGNNYFWKRWRGLPWTRPSAAAAWGHDFEGGWGPFEMVDMANAMGVEAVITTFAVGNVQAEGGGSRPITPEDMGVSCHSYRWHLGCILLEMPAISLWAGPRRVFVWFGGDDVGEEEDRGGQAPRSLQLVVH